MHVRAPLCCRIYTQKLVKSKFEFGTRIQLSQFRGTYADKNRHDISYLSPGPLAPLLQDGTGGYDQWLGMLANVDGPVILAGVSWGPGGNANAAEGYVSALKLDENGSQVWRWQVTIVCVFFTAYLEQCTGGAVLTFTNDPQTLAMETCHGRVSGSVVSRMRYS